MGLGGTIVVEHVSSGIADAGLIPHAEKTKIEEIIKSVEPDSGRPGEFKIWIRRKDGVPRYIQGKITASRNGDITSTYITIADITVFAERENALRQRIVALQELLH